MTEEEMKGMSRKEWRAYCKHMKALEKRDKEFHNLTIKELEDLTDWYLESARRNNKSAEVLQNVALSFLIVSGIVQVVAIVFIILNAIYH